MGILALFLSLTAPLAFAGQPALFHSTKILPIEIKADFKEIAAQKDVEEKLLPGTLNAAGKSMTIEVAPRGNYRRLLCSDLPPLKIILPKGKRPRIFKSLDRDMKFVTNCMPKPTEASRAATIREYLQYRLLAVAGFPGFQVRLAEVTYRLPSGEQYGNGVGFFIENIKDAMARLDLNGSTTAIPYASLYAEFEVAERFMRNFDFQAAAGYSDHNVRRIKNAKGEVIALLPYDFDRSGLSEKEGDIPEAAHQMLSSLSAVSVEKSNYAPYLRRLIGSRAALLAEVNGSPLEKDDKKYLADWINSFIDAAEARFANDK